MAELLFRPFRGLRSAFPAERNALSIEPFSGKNVRPLLYWAAGVLLLTALLLGARLALDSVERQLSAWASNPLFLLEYSPPQRQWFPPGLRFERVVPHSPLLRTGAPKLPPGAPELPPGAPELLKVAQELRNVFLGLGTTSFRPRLTLRADLLGGSVNGEIVLSGWTRVETLDVDVRWDRLDAALLQALCGQNTALPATVTRGRIGGRLSGGVSLNNPLDGNGRDGLFELNVQGLEAELALPFLRLEQIRDLDGRVAARWQHGVLQFQEIRLTSPHLSVDGQADLRLQQPFAASTLQSRLSIQLAPEHLRLPLLPPRTRAAFASGKPVGVLVNGMVSSPNFGLWTTAPQEGQQ